MENYEKNTQNLFILAEEYKGFYDLEQYLQDILQHSKILQSKHIHPLYKQYECQTYNIKVIKEFLQTKILKSIVLDVGASAGGFTQVLLSFGAKVVVAQDVGNLQLDSSLRHHKQIICVEDIDIREFSKNFQLFLQEYKKNTFYMTQKDSTLQGHLESQIYADFYKESWKKLPQEILQKISHITTREFLLDNKNTKGQFSFFNILTCDVSFISLRQILPCLLGLSKILILLFKPQFEVGKHIKRNKKGVLQDSKAIQNTLYSFIELLQNHYVKVIFIEKSLLKGKEGNEEFFIFCQF
nr:SAM-dependent methyltransferase [Helicobacter didelphidarum]